MDIGNELALRAHIRKLLLRYSLTHLTIDYVTYTRTEVSELLSECLDAVPLDDPTSLTLPVDPFKALCKNLGIKEQKHYDQTWAMDVESRHYIANTLVKGQRGDVPTERCWSIEYETTYTNPYRLTTPILTTRAIRQTPRIGSSLSSALIGSFSCCDSKYLQYANIHPVADESFEEVVISPREQENILNLRPSLDKETLDAIMSLLARVPVAQHKSPSDSLPSIVTHFLCNDASPLVNFPPPMSPPIFPRQVKLTGGPGMGKPSEIYSLGYVAPVEIKNEGVEDMSRAHMLIVDGWSVMAPPPTSQSPSSTPSLEAASQSSQTEVDELFALTPPQQLLTGSTTDKKMEEYLVPRSQKPGGGRSKKLEESKQSLANFLPQLLPPVSADIELNASDNIRHRSPPISLSILGQPPSPSDSSATNARTDHQIIPDKDDTSFNVGLDALITQICVPVDGQSAEDFIIRERIKEKEALMMDVPKLKEPYLHPNSPSCPILPTSVRSLVSSKERKTQSPANMNPKPTSIYLKKVAGVQSLNIELSWRPFNFGTRIPQTEELADVNRHPKLNSQSGMNFEDHEEKELNRLLALEEPGTSTEGSLRADLCGEPATDWAANLSEDWGRHDIVLTRAERRRVSGQPQTCLHDTEDAEIKNQIFEDFSGSEQVPSQTRSHKRRKVASSSGPDFLENSEVQGGVDPVQDIVGARFSFNMLCSTEQNLHSQHLSDDAPGWNYVGDVPDMDTAQVGGPNFLDHHSDPIWTVEAAAQSLVDGNYAHVTSVSAGTFVGNQAGSSPMTRDIYPRKESLMQAPDSVLPNYNVNLSSAVPVPPKPASRVSNPCRLAKATAQESLSSFMKLRGKVVHEINSTLVLPPEQELVLPVDTMSPPRPVPTELTDTNTLSLPDQWIPSPIRHQYIASLDLLQKTTLLKHLTSFDCNVELIERDTGVDLIIDSDTAMLFVPLAPLPVSGEALAEKVAKLSWDFTCLVIVFEAFSTSLSYRLDKDGSGTMLTPYAFPPAIVKAIRKFKRTLAILDGMVTGNKRRDMKVQYAYARNVGEAARFGRLVGDMAEAASAATTMVGDSREWLTDEYHEDEMYLAQIKGMNVYAAALILRYVDFNTFIDMEPGRRIEMFSAIVGAQRIAMFNDVIANRLTHVAVPSLRNLSPVAQSVASSFMPVPETFLDASYDGDDYGDG